MFYFRRERNVLHTYFGSEWKEFIKHPDLPRATYLGGSWAETRKTPVSTNGAPGAQTSLSTSRKLSIGEWY